MKAWYIKDKNNVELIESTLEPKENEVKVKVSKVAILYSNLSLFANGKMRVHIPGHSALANLSEDHPELGLKLGTRVVIDPFTKVPNGDGTVSKTRGIDMEGLLRDFVCIAQDDIYPLPESIKDNAAIFTDYIAMGIKTFQELDRHKGDYIVVSGASTLGLILCQLAQYYSLIPVLIDMDKSKLELAKSWGITYTLNPTFDDIDLSVKEITAGRLVDALIIAGDAIDSDAALRILQEEGEMIIAGYSSYTIGKMDLNMVLQKQIDVKGICNGDGEISAAINLLANNIIKTEGILHKEIGFNDVPKVVKECADFPYNNTEMLVSID